MRFLPPARSPLDLRCLGAGFRAAVAGSDSRRALASRLAERYGARSALLTDSGTTALRLAISGAIALREGFVALPAYACYDVATAAVGAGAAVRLYDVDPDTLEPDLSGIERAIAEGAAAVVVAHLFGQPVSVDRIGALCRAAGSVLIEDAAQEGGGRLAGRPLGSFGSLSILSFGRGKGVTGGGGGALLVHDEPGAAALGAIGEISAAEAGLVDLLVASSLWALARPSWYWLPRSLPGAKLGETVYREPTEPRGMSPVAAAIVTGALDLVEPEVDARRRHASRLRAAIRTDGPVHLAGTRRTDAEPGWLRLPVLLDASVRGAAAGSRATALGIARSYPRPLHRLAPLRPTLATASASFPGAERLADTLHTVPTHGALSARDLDALEAWLRSNDATRASKRSQNHP